MAYGSPPVLNGVVLRRPSSIDESPEALRKSVELAGGGLRSYSRGVRPTYSLAWSKLTEGELDALREAARPAFVPYVHVDGVTSIVETTAPDSSPIPGTDPVRFAVSITLRGQDPVR